jgi:hypothetical protein
VALTGVYAVCLALVAWEQGASGYVDGAAIALAFATFAQIFFATERETLTPRVRRQVPRSGGLALLATPFLPGGGRAIFLFCVHVFMAVVIGIVAHGQRASSGEPSLFPHGQAFLLFAAYLFVYVAGITLPFSGRTGEARVRWIARVTVPLVALLTIFAPSIVDFLLARHHYVDVDHPLNPFWVVDRGATDITLNRVSVVMAPLVVIVFLANLGRLDRAWREVQKASRHNRERDEARENAVVRSEASA